MDSNTDISSMTVDEIVAHLATRCPALILAACVPQDNNTCDIKFYDDGNLMCLDGMARNLYKKISKRAAREMTRFK